MVTRNRAYPTSHFNKNQNIHHTIKPNQTLSHSLITFFTSQIPILNSLHLLSPWLTNLNLPIRNPLPPFSDLNPFNFSVQFSISIHWIWFFYYSFQFFQEGYQKRFQHRDSGTQKVAEPSRRRWSCQRWQLRGRTSSWYHGETSTFSRWYNSDQGNYYFTIPKLTLIQNPKILL